MAPFCPILLRVSPEWLQGMSQSSMCDWGRENLLQYGFWQWG